MSHTVIVAAARTAVGSFNGAFANTPAHELGAAAAASGRSLSLGRDKGITKVLFDEEHERAASSDRRRRCRSGACDRTRC